MQGKRQNKIVGKVNFSLPKTNFFLSFEKFNVKM